MTEQFVRECNPYVRAVLRAVVYAVAVIPVLMWDHKFSTLDGRYVAGFFLFAVVFELLFLMRGSFPRKWVYVACLIGLGISGTILIREAGYVQGAAQIAREATP